MNKHIVFVINDFYGHGGHVKSFLSQVQEIIKRQDNIVIICSELGYIQKNILLYSWLDKEFLRFEDMKNLRKYLFSFKLYKALVSEIKNNSVVHVYSPECYFSALIASSYYNNIYMVNSVLGGPSPFPCLKSTSLYIAVSEEQRVRACNKYKNCTIIKNRIKLLPSKRNHEVKGKYVLVISRYDNELLPSLNRIKNIVLKLPNDIQIIFAGTGNMYDDFKQNFSENKNILFIGYCNKLENYYQNSIIVLGMGRSVLEAMLYETPALVIGYNGIQNLNKLSDCVYASDHNFAGRHVNYPLTVDEAVDQIVLLSKKSSFPSEISYFLNSEYNINFFYDKYLFEMKKIEVTNTNFFQNIYEFVKYSFYRIKKRFSDE